MHIDFYVYFYSYIQKLLSEEDCFGLKQAYCSRKPFTVTFITVILVISLLHLDFIICFHSRGFIPNCGLTLCEKLYCYLFFGLTFPIKFGYFDSFCFTINPVY